MVFIKIENNEIINKLRSELYQTLTAPIDAMWELLYIASSQHYIIKIDDDTIGYCCIGDNKNLIQIFLKRDFIHLMETTIKSLIDNQLIGSASLSSNEPVSFNSCLKLSKSLKANTSCFEFKNNNNEIKPTLNIELVTQNDIPLTKAFMKEQIGFDDTFGYSENLVERKELYLVRDADTIIATSECRLSDSQTKIADIGVIVKKEHQGKGRATQILKQQAMRVLELKRKPICSTTHDNLASKRAIEKAGFYCSNIIFDMSF